MSDDDKSSPFISQDIAMALEKNFTLKVMPVSVIDAANAIKLQVCVCVCVWVCGWGV